MFEVLLTSVLPAVAQFIGGAFFKWLSKHKMNATWHKWASPLAVVVIGWLAGVVGVEHLLTADGFLTQSAVVVAVHSVLKNVLEALTGKTPPAPL